jgi:hypothetical protein
VVSEEVDVGGKVRALAEVLVSEVEFAAVVDIIVRPGKAVVEGGAGGALVECLGFEGLLL